MQLEQLPEIEKPLPLFFTVQEAAKLLKMKPMMLYLYLWNKKGPPSVRFGRSIRIRKEDLLDWAKPGKRHPSVSRNARKQP